MILSVSFVCCVACNSGVKKSMVSWMMNGNCVSVLLLLYPFLEGVSNVCT